MNVAPPETRSALSPAMQAEVERIRSSGALGGGGRLADLFDYLVTRSTDDRAPKEAEIAIAVFGKPDTDALRDDPVARVYIHRLRKRLEDFYLRHGAPAGVRLDIPKGEYRLVCLESGALDSEAATVETPPDGPAPPPRRRRWGVIAAAFAALLLAVNVAGWAWMANRPAPAQDEMIQSPIWADLASSARPLLVVVGDYYIFGEYEDQLSLKRLIRDFAINSKEDLVRHYRNDPSQFDRYSDVALQYLPASTAYALTDLAPLMRGGRDVHVLLASELTPDRLKSDDILYIGLLSGLGALRDPVFAQSRFTFGESYDEIFDRSTGRAYVSEAFLAAPSDSMYRDYGFFSTFEGPAGNRIAVVSGSRDTAVMGVAEKLSKSGSLAEVEARVSGASDFEMLFEVKGQKLVNLEARVLATNRLDSATIWTGKNANPVTFPEK